MDSLRLTLIYDGTGPINWSRAPNSFGLQDKAGLLHPGVSGPDSTVLFDLTLDAKTGKSGEPVLSGAFTHGPPGGRFLYLAWAEPDGRFAQRLKIPLDGITWNDIREAAGRQTPLVGRLIDRQPRVTSTGVNIGGKRSISWC